jgi:hypothetical protein
MFRPSKLSRSVLPFKVLPNTVEVLERVRDSYKGLPEQAALTGADQAVLVTVEVMLEHVTKSCIVTPGGSVPVHACQRTQQTRPRDLSATLTTPCSSCAQRLTDTAYAETASS